MGTFEKYREQLDECVLLKSNWVGASEWSIRDGTMGPWQPLHLSWTGVLVTFVALTVLSGPVGALLGYKAVLRNGE